MNQKLPTLAEAKQQAKRLRQDAASQGAKMGHSQALEAVAQRYGFRDWNTLHAACLDQPAAAWRVGGRVSGVYLSQAFTATVLDAEERSEGWFHLVLELDEAVDVVRFESFSNLRKKLHVVVGQKGHSKERTSDGTPHLVLDL